MRLIPFRRLLLSSVLVASSAVPAQAAFLGDTLKPFVSVSELYDSNVFRVRDQAQLRALTGDDRLGDFLTIASAGTIIHYQLSNQELNLLLQKDFLWYSHYTEQDSDRDEARGSINLSLYDALKVKIDGTHLKSPESRDYYRSAALNEITTNDAGLAVGYAMPVGIGYEAAYRRKRVEYSLPFYRTNQHAVDRYAGSISYRFSPATRIYASYWRENTSYDRGATTPNNSNSADSLRVGIEESFSPRTSFSGYVGYVNRRHANNASRDYSGPIGQAAVRYGLTETLGLVLNWERQLYEETYTDRIYSITDAAGAALVYQVSAKVKGTVSDRVSWKDFQDRPGSGLPHRKDFMNELSAGMEWVPVKGLSVNISYQFSLRNSDDPSFEFSDHTTSMKGGFRF